MRAQTHIVVTNRNEPARSSKHLLRSWREEGFSGGSLYGIGKELPWLIFLGGGRLNSLPQFHGSLFTAMGILPSGE